MHSWHNPSYSNLREVAAQFSNIMQFNIHLHQHQCL